MREVRNGIQWVVVLWWLGTCFSKGLKRGGVYFCFSKGFLRTFHIDFQP